MIGYQFDLSCPRCGGTLEHVNEGPVIGDEVTAVAHCTDCGHDSSVHVRVLPMRPSGRVAA